MQHMQEQIHLKAGRLCNVTISGHKFKNLPVYERGGKGLQSLFKEYQDSLPEGACSVGFNNVHDIVKLLTMCGESKYGLSTYYIKFRHGNNIFDDMIYRIVQMYLNGSSSIEIIGFRITQKKEWQNHYNILTWEYGKHQLKQ